MANHTETKKIGGDSLLFLCLPSRAGNCYDRGLAHKEENYEKIIKNEHKFFEIINFKCHVLKPFLNQFSKIKFELKVPILQALSGC